MVITKNKTMNDDDDDGAGGNDNSDSNNNNSNNASSSSIMNELKDPLQWHEYLREAEMARRQNITIRIQQNQIHRQSLQQLLQDSMSETETAYRLAVGLSTAQEKLLITLRKGLGSMNNNLTNNNDSVGDNDKKGKDVKKKNKRNNNKDESKDDDDENDGIRNKLPPIQSIVVPNDSENNIVSILEQQHVSLYEHVTNVIPHQKHAAKRIYELAQRSMKYSNKLNDRAKEILTYLEEIESDVQRAWDTYFHAASVLFLKSSGTKQQQQQKAAAALKAAAADSTNNNNDMYTLGNVWLAELKYRSAVSYQIDEWVKNGSVLQFNFLMAKDSERQRRLRLRQYLHMTIQKQQSIFVSSSSSLCNSKSNNNNDVGDGDLWGAPVAEGGDDDNNDEANRRETTIISNRSRHSNNNNNLNITSHSESLSITTNQSETTTAQWVEEINKELENQMNEIMKQQLSGQEPNFLVSSTSALYKKRIILQKQREYEKLQQAKIVKQKLKQQQQQEEQEMTLRRTKQHAQKQNKKDGASVDENDDNDEDDEINNFGWSYEIQEANDTSTNRNTTQLATGSNTTGQPKDIEERIHEVSQKTGSISFWNDPNILLYRTSEYDIDLSREGKIPPTTIKNTKPAFEEAANKSLDETKATPVNNRNINNNEGDKPSPLTTDASVEPTHAESHKPIAVPPTSTTADDENMDRLLYSGALLESHYVQYAAVVEMKLEENDGTVMYTKGDTNTVYMAKPGQKGQVVMVMPEDEPPRLCLAVVTTDETLHLFSLPEESDVEKLLEESKNKESTTNTGTPTQSGSNVLSKPLTKIHLGSSAEDALKTILLQKQLQEKKRFLGMKQRDDAKKAAAELTDSKKNNRRLIGKQQQLQQQPYEPEEADKSLNEDNFALVPFLSMLLTEYTVRMTRRGDFGLKITKNVRPGTTSTPIVVGTTSSGDDVGIGDNNININKKQLKVRLKLASRDDQMALVSAARGQLTRMEV